MHLSVLRHPSRVRGLSAITRYSFYTPMFYRSNDLRHARRVGWIALALHRCLPRELRTSLDRRRLRALARIHDDIELDPNLGDISAGVKLKMTREECAAVKAKEHAALQRLAELFSGTVGPFRYLDLLMEAQANTTREAQLVKLADRFDTNGEALHELFAGNVAFARRVSHPTKGLLDLPTNNIVTMTKILLTRYPWLHALREPLGQAFTVVAPDAEAIAATGTPHTRASLRRPTGWAPYDLWKQILLTQGSVQEMRALTEQVEF